MNVLSLFNGMNVCAMALEDAGIEVDTQYISEIDKYANKASDLLFPGAIQLGSVLDWRDWDVDWSSIDLVTGGFPCQAWSVAGKQLGDKDERGMLFWTMLDIMKQVKKHNPNANFLIENVRMKKEFEEYITHHTEQALGEVHKILINSALVSAQNRNRYYWTNFPVEQPSDEGIVLADILEVEPKDITIMSDKFCSRNSHILRDDVSGKAKNLSAMEYVKNGRQGDYIKCLSDKELSYMMRSESTTENKPRILRAKKPCEKSNTITQSIHKGVPHGVIEHAKGSYRKLTPRECMRLQTIPEHYIDKLLTAGERDNRYQSMYNELISKKGIKSCKSAKSMNVINPSQAEKLDCVINTTLESLEQGQQTIPKGSIKARSVTKRGVIVTSKQSLDYASSTTSHGKESNHQILDVKFAISLLSTGVEGCVLNITTHSEEMETQKQSIETKIDVLNLMEMLGLDITRTMTVDLLIELLQKELQVEHSEKEKLYTMLMVTNLIIAKSISSCVNRTRITSLYIDSLSKLRSNSLEMGLSGLRMESINVISNSNLYKMTGNAWNMKTITHILKSM